MRSNSAISISRIYFRNVECTRCVCICDNTSSMSHTALMHSNDNIMRVVFVCFISKYLTPLWMACASWQSHVMLRSQVKADHDRQIGQAYHCPFSVRMPVHHVGCRNQQACKEIVSVTIIFCVVCCWPGWGGEGATASALTWAEWAVPSAQVKSRMQRLLLGRAMETKQVHFPIVIYVWMCLCFE